MARRWATKAGTSKRKRRRLNLGLDRINLQRLSAIDPRLARGTLAGLAWIAFIGGLAVAWTLGVPRLQQFAVEHSVTRAVRVEFIDAPRWFRDELAASVTRTAEMQLAGTDALDRAALVSTRDVLLETGWFDSVAQVGRSANDLVQVQARFVQPYAVIRDEWGDHLVDRSGKLLPKTYERGARTPVPALSGVAFPRPAQPGLPWEGEDVAAGLGLLQWLDRQPWRGQIVEVSVADYLRDQPLRLVTDRGSSIVWGSAPGEERALEVLAPAKLERLNYLFEHFGRIDGNHPGEVDITNERAVVTR